MTNPLIQLRAAVASDLDAILALERATEDAPHWSPAAYAAILNAAEPKRFLVVAWSGDSLAGFAAALLHPPPNPIAELESVAVASARRRLGLGRALCNAVLDWSRSLGAAKVILEVRSSSAGAIALYSALGFAPTGRRPRYYRNPDDDAILMHLDVHSPELPAHGQAMSSRQTIPRTPAS